MSTHREPALPRRGAGDRPGFFQNKEVAVLTALANDIAFALVEMR